MKTRTLVSTGIFILVVLVISSCVTTSEMLRQSAESGEYAKVQKLIEKGVDVNAQEEDGFTVLDRSITE